MNLLGQKVLAHAGTKRRPAIVIRVTQDGTRALILTGTGTPREGHPSLLADPIFRECIPLQLEKQTYFYESALCVRSVSELTPTGVRCPPSFWAKIQEFALAAAKNRLTRGEFAEWFPDAAGEDVSNS